MFFDLEPPTMVFAIVFNIVYLDYRKTDGRFTLEKSYVGSFSSIHNTVFILVYQFCMDLGADVPCIKDSDVQTVTM